MMAYTVLVVCCAFAMACMANAGAIKDYDFLDDLKDNFDSRGGPMDIIEDMLRDMRRGDDQKDLLKDLLGGGSSEDRIFLGNLMKDHDKHQDVRMLKLIVHKIATEEMHKFSKHLRRQVKFLDQLLDVLPQMMAKDGKQGEMEMQLFQLFLKNVMMEDGLDMDDDDDKHKALAVYMKLKQMLGSQKDLGKQHMDNHERALMRAKLFHEFLEGAKKATVHKKLIDQMKSQIDELQMKKFAAFVRCMLSDECKSVPDMPFGDDKDDKKRNDAVKRLMKKMHEKKDDFDHEMPRLGALMAMKEVMDEFDIDLEKLDRDEQLFVFFLLHHSIRQLYNKKDRFDEDMKQELMKTLRNIKELVDDRSKMHDALRMMKRHSDFGWGDMNIQFGRFHCRIRTELMRGDNISLLRFLNAKMDYDSIDLDAYFDRV